MTKQFIPSSSKRAEKKRAKKQYRNRYHAITLAEEKEIMERIHGKLYFRSLTLRKIKRDDFSTTFIVHTTKPINWMDFIKRVSGALEDLL